ncbi:MAG: hypothetical protein ACNI3C_11415 [Candidatus Marinarcus sp.]|uniref:hypothetical protein n=1 Tax=Candidatus Marinarcus sp. TaxID=3100987 RepID=UPI003B000692
MNEVVLNKMVKLSFLLIVPLIGMFLISALGLEIKALTTLCLFLFLGLLLLSLITMVLTLFKKGYRLKSLYLLLFNFVVIILVLGTDLVI